MPRRRPPATAPPAARGRRREGAAAWLVPAGVIAVTALVFLPSLSGQFLTWDDDRNFLMNAAYRGLGWSELRWMFTTFFLGPYQPLSWMTLGADYLVWGMNPFGYHLTNVVLHTANAWLVYRLTLRLFAARTTGSGRDPVRPSDLAAQVAAGAAALLFALHPLRVESVAWVTERRDVLSGFFALLTMLAYLRAVAGGARPDGAGNAGAAARWRWIAVALFALSLLAKASAMALPIVLVALDVWWLGRAPGPSRAERRAQWRALLLEKLPFVVLAGAAAVAAVAGQRTVEVLQTSAREGLPQRAARAFYGLTFYLSKEVWPAGLTNLYEVPFRLWPTDWHFVISAALVAAITVTAVAGRRRAPAVLVAWIGYVVLLLPVSGAAHGGGEIVADRYSYLPGIALACLAGGGLEWLWRAGGHGRASRAAVWGATGVAGVLVVLAWMTVTQVAVWHDSIALWQHAFETHPIERLRAAGPSRAADLDAYRAEVRSLGNLSAYWAICFNLGTALRAAGHSGQAADVYADAADVNPGNADIRNSWAAALIDLHQYDDAARRLEEAIQLAPLDAKAHFNLGIVRAAQQRPEDAIAAYRDAEALDPQSADTPYNLGVLLAGLGRLDDAMVEYRRAIALRPDYAEAFNNLGVALGRAGRLDEAIDAFRRALAIDPGNAGARRNLAQAIDVQKGKQRP